MKCNGTQGDFRENCTKLLFITGTFTAPFKAHLGRNCKKNHVVTQFKTKVCFVVVVVVL